MKVIDRTPQPHSGITTLGAIPVGTIFRGNVYGINSGLWTRGLFYKASGTWNTGFNSDPATRRAVVVVRLDEQQSNPGRANIWTSDTTVLSYKPLDVELVIKGVL